MSNANTETTLDAVHAGIVSAISAKFPDLQTVEAYRLDRKSLKVPACLVELTDWDTRVDPDPGTEQLAVMARFEARFIMSFRQGAANPKLEVRKLAAAFAAFAKFQRWGCPIGPAEILSAAPDDFDPELDQFEVWCVEWQQIIHLGASVWEMPPDWIPTEVYLGFAPDIGPEHIDDYIGPLTGSIEDNLP
jgi:hypothetical protein